MFGQSHGPKNPPGAETETERSLGNNLKDQDVGDHSMQQGTLGSSCHCGGHTLYRFVYFWWLRSSQASEKHHSRMETTWAEVKTLNGTTFVGVHIQGRVP